NPITFRCRSDARCLRARRSAAPSRPARPGGRLRGLPRTRPGSDSATRHRNRETAPLPTPLLRPVERPTTTGRCAVNEQRFRPQAVPTPFTTLKDGTALILEGQQIAANGVPYVVQGMIPDYGMLGFLIGYAKTGKTTFSLRLAASVAMGQAFLDQPTQPRRVLFLAIEDPPEYTAYLARDLSVMPNTLSVYREPLTFSTKTLGDIT